VPFASLLTTFMAAFIVTAFMAFLAKVREILNRHLVLPKMGEEKEG
jgi:hypothetical protein